MPFSVFGRLGGEVVLPVPNHPGFQSALADTKLVDGEGLSMKGRRGELKWLMRLASLHCFVCTLEQKRGEQLREFVYHLLLGGGGTGTPRNEKMFLTVEGGL